MKIKTMISRQVTNAGQRSMLPVLSGAIILATMFSGATVTAVPIFKADVSANLVRPTTGEPGSVFYSQSNNLPGPPTASGFGGVNNSLGQDDENLYGGSTSGSQTYGAGVSWGEGSANSNVGSPYTFLLPPYDGSLTGTAWGGATANASLDLDLTGAPHGSSVEGLANGAVGGYTYDGSDTAGPNGKYTFNVEFDINAMVAGDVVDGAVGIQVDAFNSTTGDLFSSLFNPRVSGTGINGFVDMTEETRIDGLGDAWTFSLSAADILAGGGSINGSYTAEFDFWIPNDPATANSIILTIDAFVLGEATAVPDTGSTLAFLGLGFLGLVGMRRRFAK
ncbi:VPDSG-CTERM sorting domain-containing protein [Pelagicoccus mobilis]|uniref:VPDSG-CTERM sorting domain-containing protein n=1 Tax=Pelagicoccus mobilis TaxID=415221 RepID=A0A934RWE3_9BACT|nr:VPDSG-CTERM sorting domain-containing protein [Pelagicoccus mobilis]MBK1877588.1 VPDSG-CTERM sorting domain-containing protein [Pelagicoccus mobilis]